MINGLPVVGTIVFLGSGQSDGGCPQRIAGTRSRHPPLQAAGGAASDLPAAFPSAPTSCRTRSCPLDGYRDGPSSGPSSGRGRPPSTRPNGGSPVRPRSPICAIWPVAEHRMLSSTTPMAGLARRSRCAGLVRATQHSSSVPACFETCRRSTRRPSSSGARRLSRSRLHPPVSPG